MQIGRGLLERQVGVVERVGHRGAEVAVLDVELVGLQQLGGLVDAVLRAVVAFGHDHGRAIETAMAQKHALVEPALRGVVVVHRLADAQLIGFGKALGRFDALEGHVGQVVQPLLERLTQCHQSAGQQVAEQQDSFHFLRILFAGAESWGFFAKAPPSLICKPPAMRTVVRLYLVQGLTAAAGVAWYVMVAHHFGTDAAFERWVLALAIVHLGVALLQPEQVYPNLLPLWHRLSANASRSHADALFSALCNGWMLAATVLVGLGLASLAIGWWTLWPATRHPDFPLFFGLLLLSLPLQVLLMLWQGYGYTRGHFAAFELGGLLQTAAQLIVFPWISGRDEWALLAVWWLGLLVRAGWYLTELRRLGYRHRWILPFGKNGPAESRHLLHQMAPAWPWAAARQAGKSVLKAALATWPPGTLALYAYVERLMERIHHLAGNALVSVFFTRYAAAPDAERRRLLRRYAWALAGLTLVLAIALWAAGIPLLSLLWPARMRALASGDGLMLWRAFALALPLVAMEWLWRKVLFTHGLAGPWYRWQTAGGLVLALFAAALLFAPGRPWWLWSYVLLSALVPLLTGWLVWRVHRSNPTSRR